MIGPLRRSLKTRVTLLSLLIFAISLWALAYYASKMLRTDMEQLLGDQQLSTVTLVAANIDQNLTNRLTALEKIAANFDEKELKSPATLQSILERRPILPLLFNGGYFVTDAAGMAMASVPVEAGRIGINYGLRSHVVVALGEGKPAFSAVDIGNAPNDPVLSLAVPMRNAHGNVIGSLVGVINLSSDNFLDRITSNDYGRTGGYVLVSRQQRLIVTATDKSRIMEALPPLGVNPKIDSFLAGREGSDVLRSPMGVEVLVSAKSIPVAGWYVAATLPTAEAFAPIHDMQQRMLQATIVLTLVAGALTWWMLRQQFAPIGAAAAALGVYPEHGVTIAPLPVTSRDEIGQLITGFNSLLDALATREQALQASENRFSLFMESLPGAAFIKGEDGTTLYANRYMMEIVGARDWQGKSTRDIFPPEVAEKMIADDRRAMAAGNSVTEEIIPTTDGQFRHFETHKFRIPWPGQPDLLGGIALDISERKKVEISLRESSELLIYAFNKSPLMKTLSDLSTGKYLEANDSFCRVSGFSREETIGKTAIELGWIGKDERGQMMQRLQHDGAVNGIELSLRCKNGQNIVGRYWGVIIHTAQGDKLFSAAEDITERKKTELLLHEQLDELQRWQKTMLGRESRIISIKQEVNELLARSGQSPRYAIQLPVQTGDGGA